MFGIIKVTTYYFPVDKAVISVENVARNIKYQENENQQKLQTKNAMCTVQYLQSK